MRLTLRTTLALGAGIFACAACGGGSSHSTSAGSLNVRALWQQAAAPSGFARAAVPAGGGFGPTIPRAVKTVTIVFAPENGLERCIAVDPRNVPLDSASGQRLLVLHGLPSGPATVMIAGYPTPPSRVGPACEGLRFETPSFLSDPTPVAIVPGTRTDAGDIAVFAVPFLLQIEPTPSDPPPPMINPATLRFTVADAVTGVALPVNVTVKQDGTEANFTHDPVVTACDDASAVTCSDGGDLGVTGFRLEFGPELLPLANGPAEVSITTTNRDQPPRTQVFGYEVVIVPGTGTPVPTATAAPTGTLISTPTATVVPTGTLISTPTATMTAPAGPTGSVNGTVINCLTGVARPAAVELLAPISAQTTAGANGGFNFTGVPFGAFTVRATADGFVPSELSGTLDAAHPDASVTLALCPLQTSGLRIVLTWGSAPPAPADLDAHLRGPAPGTSVAGAPVEFHLYFANNNIRFSDESQATLDIDNTNFTGPETETLTGLTPGIYRYCVHDFSDRDVAGATGIATSSAQVQVFLDNQQVGRFSAPSGPGTVWEVFQIDATQTPPAVTAVNTLSDEADTNLVCHAAADVDGDGLTAAQEAALGTDPNNFDTNGNGVSDGQDVIDGNSPL